MTSLLDLLRSKGMLPESIGGYKLPDVGVSGAPESQELGMADSLAARSGIPQPSAQKDITNVAPAPMGMAESLPARSSAPKLPEQSIIQPVSPKTEETDTSEPTPSSDSYRDVIKSVLTSNQPDIRSIENLKAAQDQAAKNRLYANLLGSADVIASSMAGLGAGRVVKPSAQEQAKNLGEQADIGVKEYQQQLAQSKDDPNSPLSKQMREQFKKVFKYDIGANYSAADIEKVLPQMTSILNVQEQAATRREIAKQNAEIRKSKEQEAADYKTDKRFSELGNKITAEIASSRGAFGKAANTKRAAESIEAFVGQGDPNNLDNRQISEIARSLDSMLSSGQATVSGMEHFIPKTALGSAAEIEEYIQGIPKGAKQGEFVRRMMETVEREKDLASKQIQRTGKVISEGYSDLKRKNPDRWNTLMKYHGIEEGGEEPKVQMGTSFPKQVRNSKTNEIATVSSPEELKEANEHGFY